MNLHGIDLLPERLRCAKETSPENITFINSDASYLPYTSDGFDIVSQFTVFSSIFKPDYRRAIASEINRVLRPGGLLLWYDMRIGTTSTTHFVDLNEIETLFNGYKFVYTKLLHPLFATRLARRSYVLCELFDRVPGFPKTHILGLLQKPITEG
jgi:ubiquinone/menaquinone biosynthesis C-methylase UbiE